MKLAPMRFMGYTWHHNPKKIEIVTKKKIVTLSAPYSIDTIDCFGEKPLAVRGVGELYGGDCLAQYKQIAKLFKKGVEAVLCLPQLAPMYACFDTLRLLADDRQDVITYEFGFTNVRPLNEKPQITKYVTPQQGDTLFDIAAHYNVDIKTLINLNSDIMFINDLEATKQVRVC